MGLEPDIEDK